MVQFAWERPFFKDRREAADMLIDKLSDYRGTHPLILAIPRGGVEMGWMIAEGLKGELDLALVRKIGMPGQPEFAIGAVSENGVSFMVSYLPSLEIPESWIREEIERQTARLREQRKIYLGNRSRISTRDRTVIIVDDGIATGSTALAAVRGAAAEFPKRIVVAAPVIPPDTLELIHREADEVVVIAAPKEFRAVSDFYEKFPEVSDQMVTALMGRRPVVT